MMAGSARSSGRLRLFGVVQPKEINGVLSSALSDLHGGRAPQGCDPLHRLDEVTRRIRLTAPTLRRQERRIGFDQHVVQRDNTGRADDPVGGGIGHAAGKRDVEASGQRFGGNRRIAAEAMEDAFHARELVEDREQLVEGAAGMEDDRFANFLGEAQHLPKDLGLGLCRRPVIVREMVVQTDFADRDHPWVARQTAQLSTFAGADGLTG